MKFYKFVIVFLLGIYSNITFATLLNGDFESGFDGWSVTTGFCCGYEASVVNFDIKGTGIFSNAAKFQVGNSIENLTQSITHSGGDLLFSADIVSVSDSINADGGRFEVFLDDVLMTNHFFGTNSLNTLYSSLNFLRNDLPLGIYDLRIDIFRIYGSSTGSTPFQYIDNITISSISPVPEAGLWCTLMLGLFTIGIRIQTLRKV